MAGDEPLWRHEGKSPDTRRQSLSFSPDGRRLAVADETDRIDLLAVGAGRGAASLVAPILIDRVVWSPAGHLVLAKGPEGVFLLPVAGDGVPARPMTGMHSIAGLAWHPDGRRLAAADFIGSSIGVWDEFGAQRAALEGHSGLINGVDFSPCGRLLYSVDNRTLRCWRTDTWQPAAVFDLDAATHGRGGGLRAAPAGRLLALWGPSHPGIDIHQMDVDRILARGRPAARTYRSAKVVLVGDTGVGKSGLGLVLSKQPYRPTDSTHARQVFTFDDAEAGGERRETLLWDLAGQPGYRLIHQLHLAEAALALVVFDARGETDPFAGVRYWTRALRQQSTVPAILVAARADRGGIAVSRARVDAMCAELGLLGYFETSAREGWQIPELAEAVRTAINWDALPTSVSTDLFATIKRFLIGEKDGPRALTTADDLFHGYRGDDRASFDACIRLLELRDLVRRLSFGGFVLLRPELLDFYASALVDAARRQPDGLGYIAERQALTADFPLPTEGRLAPEPERLLLIAVVEELLRHDLALREPTESGVDLVFPSQLTTDRPADQENPDADVVLRFDGAIQTIYATLAVRLSRVASYRPMTMWRNGSTYRAKVGGTCGIRVDPIEEGRGELTIFFDPDTSEETRYLFEDYVYAHLTTRALAGSVRRERIFTCPYCNYHVDPAVVRRRRARGDTDVLCTDCEQVRISLLDREDRLDHTTQVRHMNATADAAREAAANTATIRGKEATNDYDVFLSYHSKDRAAVAGIAGRLRSAGILPWFDRADLTPGDRWREELESQIATVKAGAVFLGPQGQGEWQKLEEQALLNENTKRGLRIIPVLLPGLPPEAEPKGFLAQWQAADFRSPDPDPFQALLTAIAETRR